MSAAAIVEIRTIDTVSRKTTNPTADVEAVLASLVDAWNRHDMAAYARNFSADADFVNVVGTHWQGRAEIERAHIQLHRTIFRQSVLRSLKQRVRFLRADIALVHAYWEMEGTQPVAGWNVPPTRRGVFSFTLVRTGERWFIRSAHNTDIIALPVADEFVR